MAISATCQNCGRSYSVKDEHAGKKFRCQGCQETVKVPVPREEAYDADDFGDAGYDEYEDYDDGEYESRSPLPAARRPAKKKKKPAAKSKRPKKRSSSSSSSGSVGAAAGKIFGGIFVGLVVMGFVVRLITAGGFDLGGSWQTYTTPDGNITVEMPGKVKSVPVKQMAPGGQSFGAERRGFACVIVIEPMPAEMNGLSEEQMFNAMELGVGFLGGTNVKGSTLKGRRCVTFETSEAGIKSSALAFLHKGKVYTLTYAYKGIKGNGDQKFFDSVQFN